VIALTPNAPVVPTEVALGFDCAGVNLFGLFDAGAGHRGAGGDGIERRHPAHHRNIGCQRLCGGDGECPSKCPDHRGANTGSQSLALTINLCQTDPQSGQCSSSIGPSVTFTISANAMPMVAFDPANNRIFVEFSDASAVVRGSASVAVETQ
jgi:hypothetical protein